MKHTAILLTLIVALLVIGLYSETTGMVVSKANAPTYLTRSALLRGAKLERGVSYIRWPGSLSGTKFSKLDYPPSLGYVENLNEPKIRYVGPTGRYKHLKGTYPNGITWKSLDKLTLKAGPVYKLYVEHNLDGLYLKYIPED